MTRFAVIVGGLVAVASLYSQLQTPMYRSTAEVLVNQEMTTSDVFETSEGGSTRAQRAMENEARIVISASVRAEVERDLGAGGYSVRATADPKDDVLDISVDSTDPQHASKLANAYAAAYIADRARPAIDDITDTSHVIRQRMEDLDRAISDPGIGAVEKQALRNQRTSLTDALSNLERSHLEQSQVVSEPAQIIRPAQVSTSPISPRTARNVWFAAISGALLALATRTRGRS